MWRPLQSRPVHIGAVILPTDLSAPVADIAVAVEERGPGVAVPRGAHAHPGARVAVPDGRRPLPDEYPAHRRPVPHAGDRGRAHHDRPARHVHPAARPARRDRRGQGGRDARPAERRARRDRRRLRLERRGGGRPRRDLEAVGRAGAGARHAGAVEQDEASFAASTSRFEPAWMWPKPVQAGGPPILLGAGPGPKTFAKLAEWGGAGCPCRSGATRPTTRGDAAGRRRHGARPRPTLRSPSTASSPTPAARDVARPGAHRVLVPLPSEPLDASSRCSTKPPRSPRSRVAGQRASVSRT